MLILDGHNLIGRAPGLSLADEAGGREELLRRVGARKGSGRENVVVVFDGNRPGSAQEGRFGGLRVVYAPAGRSADEEILRRVGQTNAQAATVVTSDRGLAARVRGLGATAESCEHFLARLARRPGASDAEAKPEGGPREVEAWLAVFRERQTGKGRAP
ncbi:MAG: NYN domain-containing protein [Deltaproteobacteria bacterium]|nr:NYN domain-containing protein [Deltaproteobacteria bacterium]